MFFDRKPEINTYAAQGTILLTSDFVREAKQLLLGGNATIIRHTQYGRIDLGHETICFKGTRRGMTATLVQMEVSLAQETKEPIKAFAKRVIAIASQQP